MIERRGLLIAAMSFGMTLAGCGTRKPSLSNSSSSYRSPARKTGDIVKHAKLHLGVKYKYGGNNPLEGFDCSGFIRYVYMDAKNQLVPRTVNTLIGYGKRITYQKSHPGDVVFFGRRGKADHAGILIGAGKFIHAPSTGKTVRVDSLSDNYWRTRIMQYRSFV